MTASRPTALRSTLATAITAAALLAAGGAFASNFSKAVYAGAKEDIQASYKAEHLVCGKLSGNNKDVCVETAKGHEKVALAQLEANYSGLPADEAKLYQAQFEADYSVAKERCDDLKGNDKDLCVRSAKTTRDKAQADLKLARKVVSAADTAVAEHQKADYKLAREKCEPMAGEAKDICVASAKARYNERW
jgi:hypothetical protein